MEDKASIAALVADIDKLDILVNNAGTAVRPPVGLRPDGFDENIAINLGAVYRLSHGLRHHIASRPGSIINIASMYSIFASPAVPGYGASKAAIVQLTKTLAALYAKDGVRVNAIAPGWISTKLTEDTQSSAERNARILDRTLMGRWGQPHEIAGTALFLASNELAGFVTGATIPVDGGYGSG